MKWMVAGAVSIFVAAGSAHGQPPRGYAPIPPLRQEVVPALPGPRVIWEPGHWHWNGVRYLWISGRYVERRPHYGRYVEGRWVWASRTGRWIWAPAHWE